MATESEAAAGTIGFLMALFAVFVMGVTISVSRCSMVGDIANDCDDYGKFLDDGAVPEEWYECKKIGETK